MSLQDSLVFARGGGWDWGNRGGEKGLWVEVVRGVCIGNLMHCTNLD